VRAEVGTAVDQAVSLRKRFHFPEARRLLEQAHKQLGPSASDDLRRRVGRAAAGLVSTEEPDRRRQRAVAPPEGGFLAVGEALYEEALATAGLGRPGEDSEAMAARMRGSAVCAETVAAVDDWASITHDSARRAWLLAVARAADPHPARDRLRQPEQWQDG